MALQASGVGPWRHPGFDAQYHNNTRYALCLTSTLACALDDTVNSMPARLLTSPSLSPLRAETSAPRSWLTSSSWPLARLRGGRARHCNREYPGLHTGCRWRAVSGKLGCEVDALRERTTLCRSMGFWFLFVRAPFLGQKGWLSQHKVTKSCPINNPVCIYG